MFKLRNNCLAYAFKQIDDVHRLQKYFLKVMALLAVAEFQLETNFIAGAQLIVPLCMPKICLFEKRANSPHLSPDVCPTMMSKMMISIGHAEWHMPNLEILSENFSFDD